VDGFSQRRAAFDPKPGHMGFMVHKMALRHIFSEYFGFSYQSLNRMLHSDYHPSSGVGTTGHTVDDVTSGLSPIPLQEKE
jgi:hypothetical protein